MISRAENLQLNIVTALISGMHPDMIAFNLSKNNLSRNDTTSLDNRQFLLLDIAFADLIFRIPSIEDDDTAPLNSKEVLLRSLYDRASLIFNSIRIQSFNSNVKELFYSTARVILRMPSFTEVAKLYEAYSLMINRGLTPENLTTYTNNLISKATNTETFLTQQVLLDIDLIRFNTNLTNQEKLTRIEQLGTSFTPSGVQISSDKYWQRYYVKYQSKAATEPFKKTDERLGY